MNVNERSAFIRVDLWSFSAIVESHDAVRYESVEWLRKRMVRNSHSGFWRSEY